MMEMTLNHPPAYRTLQEADLIGECLDLAGKRVLELGCGAGWMTRMLVERFGAATVVATEVDRRQHEKNLRIDDLPGVEFRYGGAEHIDAVDAAFDAAFMFKSLHHVPSALMGQALGEIRRVLKPGGIAYFSEPVYWGEFNALLSLFHDEKDVRQAAFDHLRAAVARGDFELVDELFFQSPGTYATWEAFEQRFIRVTHTTHELPAPLLQEVRSRFMRHMEPDGAHFLKPHRVDILRRPG